MQVAFVLQNLSSTCNDLLRRGVRKINMRLKLFIVFIAFGYLLTGCKKSQSTDDIKVNIRIENATPENFSNFRLNGTEFGSIASGATTDYRICKNVWPYPFANDLAVNNTYIYIIDIVPTPYMEKGKYRMQVMSDTLPWRYKASFIKE